MSQPSWPLITSISLSILRGGSNGGSLLLQSTVILSARNAVKKNHRSIGPYILKVTINRLHYVLNRFECV